MKDAEKREKPLSITDVAAHLKMGSKELKERLVAENLITATGTTRAIRNWDLTPEGKAAGGFLKAGNKYGTGEPYEIILWAPSILLKLDPNYVPKKKPTLKSLEKQVVELQEALAEANDKINHLFMRLNQKKAGKMYLSVTRIANKLGIARNDVNPALEELGYQIKNDSGSYAPTEIGRPYCRVVKGVDKKEKPYEMLTWDDKILKELGGLIPPSREEFEALVEEVRNLRAQLLP